MDIRIRDIIPEPDNLLILTVEELAGVLLVYLNSRPSNQGEEPAINYWGFCSHLSKNPEYPSKVLEVKRALMEAWAWLVSEGFLVNDIHVDLAAYFISRRGRQINTREEMAAYCKASLLPKGQLHASIATKVYPAFLRGEYDTAIFQALREVEVAVRGAGNFGTDDYGQDLMRDAFKPNEKKGQSVMPGPLTDKQLPVAEQEAMANLFAGAIGLYKNPQSHRIVTTDPIDGAEVIMFASQLLRIVDRLKPKTAGSLS